MANDRDAAMALLRQFGKAFNRGDVAGILACVTDDFEWRLARGPDAPDGRVVRGKDAVTEALRERDREYSGMRFSETEVHFTDDRVFGLFRAQGLHASGATIDVRGVDVYVIRDGRIASKDSYWKQVLPV